MLRTPEWEDYTTRCLPVPDRLRGEHAKPTPENLTFKGDAEDEELAGACADAMLKDSPIVSVANMTGYDAEDKGMVLYLASDYPWRGAKFLHFSGAVVAMVQFDGKQKEVQISRCEFAEADEYQPRVDTLACTTDFFKEVWICLMVTGTRSCWGNVIV